MKIEKQNITGSNAERKAANAGLFFQPKLSINQPNDVYEQEADAMADKVMRMEQQPFIQSKPLPVTPVQRKCAHCEDEEKKMQRKEMNDEVTEADHGLENYIGSLNSSGQPLPNEVRNFYEPRFGYDFSNVKVHTDNVAAKSAQSINALAYTSGNNIVFNSSQYSPETQNGKKLLGHELTHVMQQDVKQNNSNIQRWDFDNAPIGDPMRDPRLREHRPHGADHEPDQSVMDSVIIGAVIGEFNEDPSLAEIALDTGISLIPGVDQLADARDVTAHLYFMIFRGEIIDPMRWLLLCLSLIGLIPEFGSAIKGAGRVVLNGATAVLARLADVLEPFRRFIPDMLDYRRMLDFINSNWDNIVLFVRDSYRTIVTNLHALTTSFWLRITSVADNIIRQTDELYTGGVRLIDDGLERLRNFFMEIEDAVMNPHALTDSGMPMPIPDRSTTGAAHMEMSSMGSGGGGSRLPARLAASSLSTFSEEAARLVARSGGLTYLANSVKRLGQMRGATVEVALARLPDGTRILIAGLNSSARWTTEQLAELQRLGVNVAPQVTRGMEEAAPHAEENIAAFMIEIGARGERWSRAVVGAGGSYVCGACQSIVRSVGGVVEEGL